MANVIVCGGRAWGNLEVVKQELKLYLGDGDVIWHGGATGVDTFAGKAAEQLGYDVVIVPAQWKRHGKAAGPIRNKRMLELSQAESMIVFPGGRGTAHMKKLATAAGVYIFAPYDEIRAN